MLLGLLLVIIISGCIQQTALDTKELINTDNSNKYRLDELIVQFNSVSSNGLIASINSENQADEINFRNYFEKNIANIKNNYNKIVELRITYPSQANLAFVKIIYSQNTTEQEKEQILKLLKEDLEERWYSKKVNFSVIEYVSGK